MKHTFSMEMKCGNELQTFITLNLQKYKLSDSYERSYKR